MSDKRDVAIERLRMGADLAEKTGKEFLVCYSGGKDSQVVLRLAIESGVKFTAHHSLTTVDAPETIRTVRETFSLLEDKGHRTNVTHPRMNMWQLIVKKKMPPTRLARYCCDYLKEQHGKGNIIVTGVRRDESVGRSDRATVDVIARKREDRQHFDDEVFLTNDNGEKRRIIEQCTPKNTLCVNPIVDWSESDVLSFYEDECIIHNPLYREGFSRVGCIGCPMAANGRYAEFARYPQYKRAYIRAFGKMLGRRIESGLKTYGWRSGEDVFHWWMEDGVMPGQVEIDLGGDDE